MKILLDNLNKKDEDFAKELIRKIEYIAYHNYVDFRKLYDKEDIKEQQSYLKYFYAQPKENYFKARWEWLVNEYYIKKDMSRFGFKIDEWDIIDCWAYIGDSSIAFSDYFPKAKIYALEPNKKNFNELQNVIKIHKKDDRIQALNVGAWEKDSEAFLSDEGIWSKIWTTGEKVTIKSIDSLVEEYKMIPRLIKRDIEWFEYFSMLWTIETLKKHRPILFISVYHCGKDLFEIKKLIQELGLNYNFTFTRWDAMTPFSDTLLVCYPS